MRTPPSGRLGTPVRVVVITGIAGSGKTTVGQALADRLAWAFHDADDLHTADAVSRMRRGLALDDELRAPWLRRVRAIIERAEEREAGTVIACSALKRAYRRSLARGIDGLLFVFLDVPPEVALRRLAERTEHFAGPSLLASQLATLERPDEGLRLDATLSVGDLVRAIGEAVRARATQG